MTDEKYQAYLCSREWGLKREAVIKRAGGICERCERNRGNAVHHKTYARKYNELLTDLQLLCTGCHDFEHGRSDVDPAAVALNVYLAGPVFSNEEPAFIPYPDGLPDEDGETGYWSNHEDMVAEWRSEIFPIHSEYATPLVDYSTRKHGNITFNYCGPEIETCHGMISDEPIPQRCMDDVADADVMFVWIDREDTIGTLVEIGAAYAQNKYIFTVFATEQLERHFYFIAKLAHLSIVTPSVEIAWKLFVEAVSPRYDPAWEANQQEQERQDTMERPF